MNESEAENYSKHHFALMEKKLTAEASICVLATLVAGFSISALPNISYNNDDQCNCILWSNHTNDIFNEILMWLSSLFLGATTMMSVSAIFHTTGLYWIGMKKISRREYDYFYNSETKDVRYKDNDNDNPVVDILTQNEKFRKADLDKRLDNLNKINGWWYDEKTSRKDTRRLFVWSFITFTTGFVLNPAIWCNNCILGFLLFLIFLIGNIYIFIIAKKYILIKSIHDKNTD